MTWNSDNNTSLQTLKTAYQNALQKVNAKFAVRAAKEIVQLFPMIKQAQPGILAIETGMGTWSFIGKLLATSNQEDNYNEPAEIDMIDKESIIHEDSVDGYNIPVNNALMKIVDLVDFLVDTSDLNCSTWQHGFNENGVVFLHSETSDQQNPFSVPNKDYWIKTPYYKELVKANVPVVFIHD